MNILGLKMLIRRVITLRADQNIVLFSTKEDIFKNPKRETFILVVIYRR